MDVTRQFMLFCQNRKIGILDLAGIFPSVSMTLKIRCKKERERERELHFLLVPEDIAVHIFLTALFLYFVSWVKVTIAVSLPIVSKDAL